MRSLFLSIFVLAGLAGAAAAQDVAYCEWQARADAIPEPWKDHTSTFANGAVRLVLLDTIEPGAAAFHILILSPPFDELGGRQCRTIGMSQGIGFGGVDFSTLEADYDAAVGLTFTMTVTVFDGNDFQPAKLRFTVNQATGAIGARLQ